MCSSARRWASWPTSGLWQSYGYLAMVWFCVAGLAAAALATGRRDRARALWAAARQPLAGAHVTIMAGGPVHLARYRAALDAAFSDTASPAGTPEQAVERALRDA